jgi:hypothetical protein
MKTPPDDAVTALVAPLLVWACTDLSIAAAFAISGLVLLPAGLMKGARWCHTRKVQTVHAPDLSARITIPPDVLACTRAPTMHEQIELIRRLREAQQQLIQFSGGE